MYSLTGATDDCVVTLTFVTTVYEITMDADATKGSVLLSSYEATVRDTVIVTVTPNGGYDATVTSDASGTPVKTGDNKYTLTVTGDCVVTVTFVAHESPGGGDNTMQIIVAAVAVVAVLGLVVYFVVVRPKA